MESFINEGRLSIKYIKKANEGKHVAINVGAEEASGKWFFIVDSDDILIPHALEIASKYCIQIENTDEFAGVVGLRSDRHGEVWITGNVMVGNGNIKEIELMPEYIDATPIEYRYHMNIAGDRAEIIKTDILRTHKFPSYKNERFMPERYLWNILSEENYKFRWFNTVIYITEYLEDGLTRNGREMAKKNPKSRACADNLSSGVKTIPFKDRLIFCVNYYRYGMYGKIKINELISKSRAKGLSIIALPIALVHKVR